MTCPTCGKLVLVDEVECRSCHVVLRSAELHYRTSSAYRSRWMVLLRCIVGSWRGMHLRYLGFYGEAERVRAHYSVDLRDPFSPMGWIRLVVSCTYSTVEFVRVLIGAYPADANKDPVCWFGPRGV